MVVILALIIAPRKIARDGLAQGYPMGRTMRRRQAGKNIARLSTRSRPRAVYHRTAARREAKGRERAMRSSLRAHGLDAKQRWRERWIVVWPRLIPKKRGSTFASLGSDLFPSPVIAGDDGANAEGGLEGIAPRELVPHRVLGKIERPEVKRG
jgi:hypothetical protein